MEFLNRFVIPINILELLSSTKDFPFSSDFSERRVQYLYFFYPTMPATEHGKCVPYKKENVIKVLQKVLIKEQKLFSLEGSQATESACVEASQISLRSQISYLNKKEGP